MAIEITDGRKRAYISWRSMTLRCSDPSCPAFRWYGARGIAVCPEWETFEGFYQSMGDRPQGMTLERKDNSLGYSASNCAYATPHDQTRNRRSNINVTHDGRTQCLTDWCEELSLPFRFVRKRMLRGWTFEEAITTPAGERRPGRYHPGSKLVEYRGEHLPLSEISRRLFGHPGVIRGRLSIGWTLDDAINLPRMSRGKKLKYLVREPQPFAG